MDVDGPRGDLRGPVHVDAAVIEEGLHRPLVRCLDGDGQCRAPDPAPVQVQVVPLHEIAERDVVLLVGCHLQRDVGPYIVAQPGVSGQVDVDGGTLHKVLYDFPLVVADCRA